MSEWFGTIRETRVTARISVTHNRPTGLGALLNPTPAQQNMADANYKLGIHESWAGNHPTLDERLNLLKTHTDKNDNGEYRSGHSIVRTVADETHAIRQQLIADSELNEISADNFRPAIVPTRITDNPAAIRHAEIAAASANPVAYIQNNVPAKLRAAVVAIATR